MARRSVLTWIKQAPKLAASLGAIVGLAAGILGLVAYFRDPQSDTTSGEIVQITRDPNVPLGDYLRRENRPRDDYTQKQLRTVGNVFEVVVEVKGHRGNDLPLRWTLREAESEARLPEAAFNDQTAGAIRVKGAETTQRAGGRFWLPLPPRSGTYFVRFELREPDSDSAWTADSKPFQVAGAG